MTPEQLDAIEADAYDPHAQVAELEWIERALALIEHIRSSGASA